MKKPFRMLTVVGARPQFVKAAAISRALAGRGGVEEMLLHTGQHFDADMSRIFFDELGIAAPHVNLGIHGGNHGAMTGRMMAGIEEAILAERPDLVLVPGDTNSTLAGALAAAKLHVPVAHLEAGLRSFNRAQPEELNRVLTDHASALLLCPTETAIANLRQEGIVEGVHDIGDVMYDAALFAAARARGGRAARRWSSGWASRGSPMRLPRCIAPRIPTTRKGWPRSSASWRSGRAIARWCCRCTRVPERRSRAGGSISARSPLASRSAISICTGFCSRRLPSTPIRAGCKRRPIFTACHASRCAAKPNGSRP